MARESNSPGKVWSSPSDVPAAPPLRHHQRQPGLRGSQSFGAPPPKKAKAVPVPAPGLECPAVLRNAEAEETLLCGPDWPRWRWSWKPLRGAPSQVGGAATGELAEALKAQTAAIVEALASGRGGQSSITTVKTDVAWPTLTDDKSDARHVVAQLSTFLVAPVFWDVRKGSRIIVDEAMTTAAAAASAVIEEAGLGAAGRPGRGLCPGSGFTVGLLICPLAFGPKASQPPCPYVSWKYSADPTCGQRSYL